MTPIWVVTLALAATSLGGLAVRAHAQTASVQGCMITGGANTHVTLNCTFDLDIAPKVLILQDHFDVSKDQFGKFVHRLEFRLTLSDNIVVRACGAGVTNIYAVEEDPGVPMSAGPWIGKDDGCHYRQFSNAVGRWSLQVTTDSQDADFTAAILPE